MIIELNYMCDTYMIHKICTYMCLIYVHHIHAIIYVYHICASYTCIICMQSYTSLIKSNKEDTTLNPSILLVHDEYLYLFVHVYDAHIWSHMFNTYMMNTYDHICLTSIWCTHMITYVWHIYDSRIWFTHLI